jgi:endonuclease/exonuclease/phosphatase family metal-dependent hydrolase
VPPVLHHIGSKETTESNTFSFSVSATPTDNDTVTLTVSNAPAGAVFSSTNEHGTFNWSAPSPAGVYTMQFYAADNDGVDSETVVVTVNGRLTSFLIMAANMSSQVSPCDTTYQPPAERIFRGLAPDVVAIQEWNVTNAAGRRAFVDVNFGTNFDYYSESPDPSCPMPNGIISRWPIVDSGTWNDPEVYNRDFAWASISVPGARPLHVVSVHLKAGSTSADYTTRVAQARALTNLVANNFSSTNFVVLAGDLNLQMRSDPCMAILTNAFLDDRKPADQYGDEDTNIPRSKPYDVILPNLYLNSNHASVVIGGLTFTEGAVFDSRLFASPPSPILTNDSAEVGMQHLGVLKKFNFNYIDQPPTLKAIGDQALIVSNDLFLSIEAVPTEGDAVTLSVSNAPAGATFSSVGEQGSFSWLNIPSPGVYTTSFYAVDNDGAASETIVISVLEKSSVLISEVADPADDYYGRFVELYAVGTAGVDFAQGNYYLSRQVNGQADSWYDVALTGVLAAGETYVIAYDATNFYSTYGRYPDQVHKGVIAGNGDDAYMLYLGGDHADGALLDIYGELNSDGTDEAWEYTDCQATRNADVSEPSAWWTSNEWTIISGRDKLDMTPGYAGSNMPPVLAPIGNRSAFVSNQIQFSVNATLTESDPVTLSISNAPAGSTFSSTNENGTFTWASPDPIGVYTMVVYAADDDGADSELITITVNVEPPTLLISEVADPSDEASARFVELYNPGAAMIDLSTNIYYVSCQVNGGSTWSEVQLTGTIAAGSTYLVANDQAAFFGYYGEAADIDFPGTSGNGDDAYFLYAYNDHNSGILLDIYGERDVDGTGHAWEYENSHATRGLSVSTPNTTWTSSEWVIASGAMADMTPGLHGYGQPPAFGPLDDQQTVVSNALSFDVEALDLIDGDDVTLWATDLPSGASFASNTLVGGVTNTFSWTAPNPAGIYTTTFWAADADGTNSETITITVAEPSSLKLLISEVADPGDNSSARFVELYNAGASSIDFSTDIYYLSMQVNGGSTWYEVQLTGTVAAGGIYLAANDPAAFSNAYGVTADIDMPGTSGNGDDGVFLYQDADHASGFLVDAFGVIGVDGTGQAWEYENARAMRETSITAPNKTWTSSEWTIVSADVADMTPGWHVTPPSNQPPELAVIGDQVTTVSNTLSFDVSAQDPADGDEITLYATDLPAGAAFSTVTNAGGVTNTFSWTTPNPAGVYTSTFWAVDKDGTNSETITILVNPKPEFQLLISEIADPGDNASARFFELYNAGTNAIDLDANIFYLGMQVNGGSTWYEVQLTGSVAAADVYVVASDLAAFSTAYGTNADIELPGTSGNGDDGCFLYYDGTHTNGTLLDAYGVVDVDGTGQSWEYENARALRDVSVTQPNPTWTSSEWTIVSADVADMTPGWHVIAPSNLPPELNEIGSRFTILSNALSFSVSALDEADGDDVTLYAQDLPAGASFATVTNAGGVTNTFSWATPGPVGVYTTTFHAADQDGTNSEAVLITVKPTPPSLLIAEVADPQDEYLGRFVELYNPNVSAIDFSTDTFYLGKQMNGGSTWYEVQLTGTVAAGGTYLIANSAADFAALYGFEADIELGGTTSGNGDDPYILYAYGDHTTGIVVDIYGAEDTDGTDSAWEYTDTQATRDSDVTDPNPTWTAAEWTIGTGDVVTLDMTPGYHGTNMPPVLNAVGSKAVMESNTLQFTVSAAATDADTVTLTMSNAPAGASLLSTNESGSFVWSSAEPVGVYTTTIYAADKDGVDRETITITVTPYSALLISEIMQDPSASDDTMGEWVELYNRGDVGIDINGWTLADGGSDAHTITNGGALTVPAKGFVVLARSSDSATNGGVAVDYEYNSFTLNNTADEVILLNGSAAEVTRVSYDGGVNFPDPSGASMYLISPDADQNAGASWAVSSEPWVGSAGDYGTPGALNDQGVWGVNIPPVLDQVTDQSTYESNLLQFSVSATPTDGDAVTLSMSNAPAGASFSSTNENGTFTWTTPTPVGVYTTMFYAADADGTDVETVLVTVNPNTPPVLTYIGDRRVALSNVLRVSVYAVPTEEDTVTLTASNLPAGAVLTTSNEYGWLTWSNAAPLGVYTSSFHAADDDGVDGETITITVSAKPVTSNTLVYYDFDTDFGGFTTAADAVADHAEAGAFTSTDAGFTNSAGLTGQSVLDSDWTNAGRYFEFSLTVSNGYEADISELQLYDRRSSNGPTNWIFRSSLAAYTTDLYSGATHTNILQGGNTCPLTIAGATGTVTFRIYGEGAAAASGTWRIDDVQLLGSIAVTGAVTDADGDGILDTWELAHFGAITNVDETTDWDGDRFLDINEYKAGTQPTNASSLLDVGDAFKDGSGDYVITWSSVSGKQYQMLRGTNLNRAFSCIASNLAAVPPENTYTDAAPPSVDTLLYRIQLQE